MKFSNHALTIRFIPQKVAFSSDSLHSQRMLILAHPCGPRATPYLPHHLAGTVPVANAVAEKLRGST